MIKRTKKYYAPQNENVDHKCDYEGCTEKGEFRAPKDRSLKEYYWFCLKHVQEYNSQWNYYAGEQSNESEEANNQKMHFNRKYKSKIRYQFGYDLWEESEFFEHGYSNNSDYNDEYSADGIYFTLEERKCIKILEMDIKDINLASLKIQYKVLAKKYHPDVNREDKNAEEKFKQISSAYQTLCDKFGRLPDYDF